MSNFGDDRVERIPSLLRGSFVVCVTSKDILMVLLLYFIVLLFVPTFKDVFPLIGYGVDLIGHVKVEVKPLL